MKPRFNYAKVAPGVYDALSGLIAEQTGAEAVYLSGASIAYTRFGRPDLGLVSMSEVSDTIAALQHRIEHECGHALLVVGDVLDTGTHGDVRRDGGLERTMGDVHREPIRESVHGDSRTIAGQRRRDRLGKIRSGDDRVAR